MYSPVHKLQGARQIVTTLGKVGTTTGLGSIGKGLSLLESLLLTTGIALLLSDDASGY
jgi:hypothetical protein